MPKDAFIFTEFTNPDILETRGMVEVRVLLLDLALTCRQCVCAAWGSFFLGAHGGRLPTLSGCLRGWGLVVHGASLCPLCGDAPLFLTCRTEW